MLISSSYSSSLLGKFKVAAKLVENTVQRLTDSQADRYSRQSQANTCSHLESLGSCRLLACLPTCLPIIAIDAPANKLNYCKLQSATIGFAI